MKVRNLVHTRVLSIALGSRGFGYAIFEGSDMLIDWGIRAVTGDKNNKCLENVEEMIMFYKPNVLVMEDYDAKETRHSERIRSLSRLIMTLAKEYKLSVRVFTPKKIIETFFSEGGGTKHAQAEIIAKRFPEELGHRLPHKRRAWESECYGMDMFEAVAVGMVFICMIIDKSA